MALAALLAALFVRAGLVESYYVPDRGMEPVLAAGDRVLVAKVNVSPERGQVVVADVTTAFAGPDRGSPAAPGVIGRVLGGIASALGVRTGERSIVARVVALGGDTVSCSASGRVLVGAREVSGDIGCTGLQVVVPKGSVWLLGDDPAHATDSLSQAQESGQGVVPVADLVGRVIFRVWPPGPVESAVGEKVAS